MMNHNTKECCLGNLV